MLARTFPKTRTRQTAKFPDDRTTLTLPLRKLDVSGAVTRKRAARNTFCRNLADAIGRNRYTQPSVYQAQDRHPMWSFLHDFCLEAVFFA